MTTTDPSADATSPSRRPARRPGAATDRGECPNLVGRIDELDRLTAAFDAAVGGHALAVLIGGDAGIGKSRLVDEFCDRVRLRGAQVATGMCVPADAGLPFAPVMGILRELGRSAGRGHGTAVLGFTDPDSAAPGEVGDSGPSAPGPVAGAFARTMFFEAILQSVVELVQSAPLVLVVEDLQWADSASTELLDFLVRNLGDARVLIVGTYRTEEFGPDHPLTPWLSELGRHARVRRLALGPLDRSELGVLIEAQLAEHPEPELVESVWARSQGNPFFAEELVAARDLPMLPTAVLGVIRSRIARLSPPAQHVLGIAAVAGSAIEHDLLEVISDLDTETLDAAVIECIDHNILLIDPDPSGYRFRHALLREAVLLASLPARRRLVHRQIASALAADPVLASSSPSHRIAELARHWWAAQDWAAALQPSLDALDAAVTLGAFREAFTFLEHAVMCVDRAPEAASAVDVVRLLEQGADLGYLAGANDRAVELARAAIDAIDADGDPIAAARCYTLLGRNLWGVGDSDGAFDAYRRAIDLLPTDRPSVELARLLAEQARGYMLMSLTGIGEERARAALAAARQIGARDVEGHALNTLGCCRRNLGFQDEAVALIREALTIAEDLGSPDDLNRAYSNLGLALADAGRLDDAVSIMFDSAAVGEDLWGVRLNGATSNGVDALVRMGRYDEAERVLAQLGTQALGVCTPSPWTLPAPMMIRRGNLDAAERAVGRALQLTAQLQDVQQSAYSLGLATELDLEQGRPDAAVENIERALTLAARSDDEIHMPELCTLAARAIADLDESSRAHGRSADITSLRRRADEIVAAVRDIIDARERRGAAPGPRLQAAYAQAGAERSRLDRSDPDAWRDAAHRWDEAREPYPGAYCRWREAEALLETRGDRARASECLDRAWQVSHELGSAILSSRVSRLAQRGRLELHDAQVGEAVPADQAAADLGLTAREVEVLGYLAGGCSDRQIGEALFISKKTVSVHVSNLLRKLALTSRVEAGRVGQAHGLSASSTR
ncbi:MAG: hypothetical protein QOH29_1404 [Actinomycetota bacterium]|nr:hypothetical protein [Actinomycetota bacterium]